MRRALLLSFALPLLLLACVQQHQQPLEPTVIINDETILVEIADEPHEHQLGLMNRTSLAPDSGMLFVFDQELQRYFWMKNTVISLDILYINNEHQIVDIQTMQPCLADPCQNYPSAGPAQYALEVNAGYAVAHNISVGHYVEFVNIDNN